MSSPQPSRKPARRLAHLRNWFLTGLVVTGPLAITIYLVWALIQWADQAIVPFVPKVYNPDTYLPFHVPGFGILVGAFVITAIGFLAANFFGHQAVAFGERLLRRLPLVRNIYNAVKQMVETIFSQRGGVFQRAVLIEFPRKGSWAIALVAPGAAAEVDAHLAGPHFETVSVFVPTTPNPTTGFLTYVAREETIPLEMSIEDALKMVISAGLVAPDGKAAEGDAPIPSGSGDARPPEHVPPGGDAPRAT